MTGQKPSTSSFLVALLTFGWYAVAFVLAATIILVVAGANVAVDVGRDGPAVDTGSNVSMRIPVSVALSAAASRVEAPALGIIGAELQDVTAVLRFPPKRGAFLFANLAMVIGLLAVSLWVIWQLRELLRTLRDGQPFVPANAARVRRIAWAVIVGELGRAGIGFFEASYAAQHFTADGLQLFARAHVNVFVLIDGLIILAIAEVFRAGTRLDEDQSLTV